AEAAASAWQALRAETVPGVAEVGRRRAEAEAAREALAPLLRLSEEAVRLAGEAEAAGAELARCRAKAGEEAQAAADAAAALDRAGAVLAEAEETLRRLHLAGREDVEDLRRRLVPGEPCPVCGGAEHPWASEPLKRMAGEQEERVAALRGEHEALLSRRAGHASAAAAASARAAELEASAAAIAARRTAAAARWEAASAGLDLPGDAAEAGPVLADRAAAAEAALAVVRAEEALALDHARRLEEADTGRRTAETALAGAQEALARCRSAMEACQHAATQARSDLARAEAELAAALAELAEPLAGLPGWRADLARDPDGFPARLGARAADFRSRQERAAQLSREADAQRAARAGRAAALEEAEEAERGCRRRAEGLRARLAEVAARRAGLLGGRSVAEVKAELAAVMQRARATLDLAATEHQAASSSLLACERELATRTEALEAARRDAGAAAAALADAAGRLGLSVEEAKARLARDESWLQAEEAALSALDAALREAGAVAADRARRLEEHRRSGAPEGDADAARARLEATQAAAEAARAALAETRARLRADAEARQRLAAIVAEWEAQKRVLEVWAALDQLIGSASGQKLRNFAQSLSLDLLLDHANRYLEELARRYRLQRVPGADLEIQVIDREMADEVRGVHSLSGGEMFLVSLALALGLSSMSGAGAGIGTLFIDEGFGTLDPDSLELALTCLEALQTTGRQVGVISHVPGLVDRIGAQVRVVPLGGGRSTVSVVEAGGVALAAE
ncbi:MAG TPA: SbcC/MukB-like Walker B domain-containing protein, partial [Azospirillaceae bacterium]|nr:SbcC/MukB-like Walker B domain-containing protein [Azospirillaceae bacterium]